MGYILNGCTELHPDLEAPWSQGYLSVSQVQRDIANQRSLFGLNPLN